MALNFYQSPSQPNKRNINQNLPLKVCVLKYINLATYSYCLVITRHSMCRLTKFLLAAEVYVEMCEGAYLVNLNNTSHYVLCVCYFV